MLIFISRSMSSILLYFFCRIFFTATKKKSSFMERAKKQENIDLAMYFSQLIYQLLKKKIKNFLLLTFFFLNQTEPYCFIINKLNFISMITTSTISKRVNEPFSSIYDASNKLKLLDFIRLNWIITCLDRHYIGRKVK